MVSKVGLTLRNVTLRKNLKNLVPSLQGPHFSFLLGGGGVKVGFQEGAKVTFPPKTYTVMTETQQMTGIFKIIQMQRGKCPTCPSHMTSILH